MNGPYYVGVDVGTGSVRAALVNSSGKVLELTTKVITTLQPQPDFYEQSSEEIWSACCHCVKSVVKNVSASDVHGIGFDATCSLVVLDKSFQPMAVSDTDDDRYNIVLWMDHRAQSQANLINETRHDVLKFTGGTISLEMQPPKLLWLKQNLGETRWRQASHFFDLPDFLTWKATGSMTRSLCSLVCKWAYQANSEMQGWDKSFLKLIGLEDLLENDCSKIGNEVKAPGQACGEGLSIEAAADLGLNPGTPVSTSIIDAHAGGLGTLGCRPKLGGDQSASGDTAFTPLTSRLALICGTSTCHMIVSSEAVFVPGVWGPYYSAMIPQQWLNEGGQSATGKLIDHVITSHPAYDWIKSEADTRQVHINVILDEILKFMVERDKPGLDKPVSVCRLSQDYHVQADYHGNRSPIADPTLRGMVSGLRLAAGAEDLALQYLATVQALAYGTREIIEAMRRAGHTVFLIYICGGLAKNQLFVQTSADVLGLPVVLPDNQESVLLGSALLGAVASGDFSSIQEAMNSMSGEGHVVYPNLEDQRFHEQKYKVYLAMRDHQFEYRRIMNSAS